ncbi:MAG TPA: YdcF family protein [Bryobacteraceae bacterium]|jgi:uncharacterized SAM-binding protein YcdF (DUF218 family)|nr:YdcF family protein [Bryobacteraceae bacterium]
MSYIQPFFPLLVLAIVVGALRFWKSRPWWTAAAAALFLFCWPPAASLAVRTLEGPYLSEAGQASLAASGVGAIVVLSGAVYPSSPEKIGDIPSTGTLERCHYAAWLNRNAFPVPVLATGGGSRGGVPYAVTMAREIERCGVPKSMIWTEERSRSTYENAKFSAAILGARGIRRIALVTEAFHMRRSELSFEKSGIEVVPAPCGFRATIPIQLADLLPSSEAIEWNEDTLHEWLGLLWYKSRGRI